METVTGTEIDIAAHWLREGECVGIPTETVYGLAANALDVHAVSKVFKVKQRPDFDPLIVHVASPEQAALYADFYPLATQLSERFWPGPLTLVLPRKDVVPYQVTSGLDTVAIRIPDHSLTLELLASLDFPLAAPSANPFGYISPTTARHVNDQLGGKVPFILDGGECRVGLESTIIGFENGQAVIYRLGFITPDMVREVTGNVQIRTHSSSDPKAPGMLTAHYAPHTPMFAYTPGQPIPEGSGFIGFSEYTEVFPAADQVLLSPGADEYEAARNLYAMLREMDNRAYRALYIEVPEGDGLILALADRIRRAVAHGQ